MVLDYTRNKFTRIKTLKNSNCKLLSVVQRETRACIYGYKRSEDQDFLWKIFVALRFNNFFCFAIFYELKNDIWKKANQYIPA